MKTTVTHANTTATLRCTEMNVHFNTHRSPYFSSRRLVIVVMASEIATAPSSPIKL